MADEMAEDSGQAGQGTGDPIDVDEVQHHIEILQRIVTSPDADDRQRLIIEGLARFGIRFNATLGMAHERFPELFEDYAEAVKRWLCSEPILGWADEAERRAHFATETIDAGQDGLLRLAARALLAVPETSPNRDDARARRALLRHLELGEADDDADMQVAAIDELVGNDLVESAEALDLLARGNRLLDRTDMERVGRDFLVGVLGFNLKRAIRARDAGDEVSAEDGGQRRRGGTRAVVAHCWRRGGTDQAGDAARADCRGRR